MTKLPLVAICILLLPVGSAGSPDAPEIADGEGEIQLTSAGLNLPAPEIDIRAVWLSSNATHVVIHWRIANLSERSTGSSGAVYALTYEDEDASFGLIEARRTEEQWRFRWLFVPADESSPSSATVTGVVDDGLEVHVPKTLIVGTMYELQASTILLTRSTTGGHSGGGTVWFRDSAPEAGDRPEFTP